jgi:hypothetical protein
MNNYTGDITFKVDIEAFNKDDAAYIANQALPTHFNYSNSKGGSGKFLRGLMPVVYEQEESGDKPDSYWRNR